MAKEPEKITELDERKVKILVAVIRNYLETGEPVGSRTISKYTDLKLSSATIRNEMADLEEMGYIFQPHTSSGRIPTDKGYRFYVDNLMSEKEREIQEKEDLIIEKADKLEEVLKQAAKLLAANTNYTALVSTPETHRNKLKFLQLSKVDENSILAVIVVEGNIIKNKMIHVDEELDDDTILKLNLLFNTHLNGLSLEQINLGLIAKIKKEAGIHGTIVEDVIDAASAVYVGTVCDVSFIEKKQGELSSIYTVYTVSVSETLKGKTFGQTKILVNGVLTGVKEDESRELMDRLGIESTYVCGGVPVLEINHSYLFCVTRSEGYDWIVNPSQFAYDTNTFDATAILTVLSGRRAEENGIVPSVGTVVPADAPAVVLYGEDVDSFLSSSAAELRDDGLCAFVRAVSAPEDVYLRYGEQAPRKYRLVLFEVQEVVFGRYSGTCFYLILQEEYQTDFTDYDTLAVYNLHQMALDGYVLYNQTKGGAERLSYPLFGQPISFRCDKILAYRDGRLDLSLWEQNEAWKSGVTYFREDALARFGTVDDFKREASRQSPPYYNTVLTLGAIEDEEARRLLSYVSDLKNGIYVTQTCYNYMNVNSADLRFTRYLNGLPTDEIFHLCLDFDEDGRASVYHVDFGETKYPVGSIGTLPDLAAAIASIRREADEGRITPPHLTSASVSEMRTGVTGWYVSDGGTVCGVIRVVFVFRLEGDSLRQYRIDDWYGIVESDGTVTAVTRDEALARFPDDPYLYRGEYVENGRPAIEIAIP